MNHATYDAQMLVEVSQKEFLLIFQKFGLYVDTCGKRSRSQELMFPAVPISFAYSAPYLAVFAENHVDIFNVNTAEWIQTLNLKKVRKEMGRENGENGKVKRLRFRRNH